MTELQSVTLDEIKHLVSDRALEGETVLLNMGPQHPSTHGVLRLLLELDGEEVVNTIPDIGFLHTGVEKNMEAKTYQQAEVMSDRLDYLTMMQKLEKTIIPMYYDNEKAWLTIAKNGMNDILAYFSSSRMVKEYYEKMYDY